MRLPMTVDTALTRNDFETTRLQSGLFVGRTDARVAPKTNACITAALRA
jgi:hypothetical protein